MQLNYSSESIWFNCFDNALIIFFNNPKSSFHHPTPHFYPQFYLQQIIYIAKQRLPGQLVYVYIKGNPDSLTLKNQEILNLVPRLLSLEQFAKNKGFLEK